MPQSQNISHAPVTYGGEVYVPIRIDSMRLDTVPEFALYFRAGPAQPFVLYCERSIPFTRAARKRLETNKVEQLYIRGKERKEYHQYLAGHLEAILRDPKLSIKEKSGILYDSAQAVVEDVLSKPPSRNTIDRGKDIVQQTIGFMTSDGFMIEHLLRTISCDYYLYTHSVNVVAYSIALAIHAGFRNPATLRETANGALLHDIGKSTLDARILNKTGALSPAEWEAVQAHPAAGHRMLREVGNVGEIALDVILHHHERLNGSGYPDGLEGDALSPSVQIVTIADVFDALTSDRYHQQRMNTFDALSVMSREMREELNPDFLCAFVEIMGARVKL